MTQWFYDIINTKSCFKSPVHIHIIGYFNLYLKNHFHLIVFHSILNKYEHVHLHTYTLNTQLILLQKIQQREKRKKYSIKMKMCFKNQTSQPKSSA